MREIIENVQQTEFDDDGIEIGLFAKLLSTAHIDGIEIGRFAELLTNQMGCSIEKEKLIEWLKQKKYLMSSKYCEPYQKYIEKGWFALRRVPIRTGNTQVFKNEMLVSEKGQKQIVKLLISEGNGKQFLQKR